MKSFEFIIKDELGIHARPAGQLAKTAKQYQSEITLSKDGKTVVVTKLMALMSLGIKYGDKVTVTVSGPDEEVAAKGIQEFFKANL